MSTYVRTIIALKFHNAKSDVLELLQYPKLTLVDLAYIKEKFTKLNNDFAFDYLYADAIQHIAVHPLVTIEWLIEQNDINWKMAPLLISNPNITTKIVEKYPEFDWNWQYMHELKDLNSEFIEKHIEEDWHWSILSGKVEFEIILKHPEKQWNFRRVSLSNPSITLLDVIEHQEIEWYGHNLVDNAQFMKNFDLDLLIAQFDENYSFNKQQIFVSILRNLFQKDDLGNIRYPMDILIEQLDNLPKKMEKAKWWFTDTPGYVNYMFEKKMYLRPDDITRELLRHVSIESINEKVALYYDKRDIELANVVRTNMERGRETNWGIRNIIGQYL
jgi:hypothetical protein